MAVIEAGMGIVTHINVFTVAPEKQEALGASLTETVKAASGVPGGISASIHRSFDGLRVTSHVQHESQQAAKAAMRHLTAGGFIQRNVGLAQSPWRRGATR